jgi:hypothetical protein
LTKPIKYLLLIVITAFLAAGVYLYKPISGSIAVLSPGKPCSEPMSFSFNEVDTRFSISASEAEEAAEKAAELWNQAAGHMLIRSGYENKTEPDITINFIYDERQERTDSEHRFREQIRSGQIRLDQLQAQHDQRRAQFDEQSNRYLELADRTTRELNALNEWVSEKNEKGGFTEQEYEQFQKRKAEVEQKQDRVFEERKRLDQFAKEINREMEMLNEKFGEKNRLIEMYNTDFAGDMRFTKATYQRAGNRGIITVNQFMDKQELILILAHEMGHALGLGHLPNPKSVMFSRMGAQSLHPEIQLTEEDHKAIHTVCN